MSEPRTQSGTQGGAQPVEASDARLDALLKDALNARHMPPGLAEKTMAHIHARANAGAATGTEAGLVAQADATPLASNQASNPQVATPQLSIVQPPAPEKRQRANTAASRRPVTRRRFVQLMAACIAASALAVGGGALAFADETAQVEIDGSAVAELGLNRWDRVVRVWASDDDLADALSALGLIGMTCEDALTAIAADSAATGFLARDRIELVACSDNTGQMQSVFDACSATANGFGPGTACSTADSQTRAEARAAGMGVARYQVYCEIAAIDPTYTAETCAPMSMRELRDLLARLTGEAPEGAGHGGGQGGNGTGRWNGQGGNGAGMGSGAGRGQGHGGGHGQGMGRGVGSEHEE